VLTADPDTLAREIMAEWPFEVPELNEAGIYTMHDEVSGEVTDAFTGGIRRDVPRHWRAYPAQFQCTACGKRYPVRPDQTESGRARPEITIERQ
jgi:hypothetical protein